MPRRPPERETTIYPPVIPDYLDQCQDPVWGGAHEDGLRYVLEAYRRFHAEVEDSRLAGVLTLAWSSYMEAYLGD